MPKKSKESKKKRETKTDKKRRRKIAKLDKERAEKIKKERQALNDKIKKIIPARVGARSRANITEVVAPSGSRGGVGSYKPRRTPQQIKREKEKEARRILGVKKAEKEIEQLEEPVQRARAVRYNQTVRTPIGGFTGLREGYGIQSNPNKKLEEKIDNLQSKLSNLEKREKESVDTPQIREVETRRRPLIEEVQDKSKELLQSRIRRGVQETQERNRQREIDRQTLQEKDRQRFRNERLEKELQEETQKRLIKIDEKEKRKEKRKEKQKRIQEIKEEILDERKFKDVQEQTDEEDFEDEEEIIKIQEQNKLVDDIMGDKKERTITFEPQENFYEVESFNVEEVEKQLRRKDKSNRTNPPSSRKIQTIEEVSKKIIQDLDEEPLLKKEKEKTIQEIKIPSTDTVNIIDEEPEDINIQTEPPQPSIDNTKLIQEQIRKDKLLAQKTALEQARAKDAKIRQREFLEEEERKQKSKDIVSNIFERPVALSELRETETEARKKGQGRPKGENVLTVQRDIEQNTDEKRRLVERREQLLIENQEIINELFSEYKIDGSVFPINIRELNKVRSERDYTTFRNELIRAIEASRNIRYRKLRKQIINRTDKFNRLRKEINNLNQKIRK